MKLRHYNIIFCFVTFSTWLVISFDCTATTYYVRTNGNDGATGTNWATAKQTIQAGVDAATNVDDTVVVSNGTYVLTNQINISKAITVRSESGRDLTIVDGSNSVRGFYITASSAIVDGFTITNGFVSAYGGGAYLTAGSLVNCTLTQNATDKHGGGAYLTGGTVSNCVFIGNISTNTNSSDGRGGAVYINANGTVRDSELYNNLSYYDGGGITLAGGGTVIGCSIVSNTCTYDGGGIAMFGGTISNCTITANISGRYGGGIKYDSGSILIADCVLKNNEAASYGGGIYHNSAGPISDCIFINNKSNPAGSTGRGGGIHKNSADQITLQGCKFINNSSSQFAGGIWVWNMLVSNCSFTNNVAAAYGGGVYMSSGSGSTMRNCLLIGNYAGSIGGGICFDSGSSCIIENCTIAGNQAGTSGGGVSTVLGMITNSIVYFNDAPSDANVQGTNTYYSCMTPLVAGTGNITNNPMFVNSGSEYGTNHVAGNYHLTRGSRCINVGTNLSWMESYTDLDGNDRILAGIVDMGAYETLPPPSGTAITIR